MTDIMQIDRRLLLSAALKLVGAAATASISPAAFAQAAASPKRYLAPASFTLLSAIADTIIPRTDTPGAVDARVPAKFDALLVNWASPEHRVMLTGAMTKIDAAAKGKYGKGFALLTPVQRNELLVAHDIAGLKPIPRTEKLASISEMVTGPAVADPAYAMLKELIVLLYYYSEEALTTELVYEHVPGGWTPSVKVTPETRATGGMGMF